MWLSSVFSPLHMRLMCRQLYLLVFCALLVAITNGNTYQEVKNWRTSHYKQQDDCAQTYHKALTREKLLRISKTGPGSSPPMCKTKCGSCTPCSPVRVAVPPGAVKYSEYYPEAWRCKCRNRLYIP